VALPLVDRQDGLAKRLIPKTRIGGLRGLAGLLPIVGLLGALYAYPLGWMVVLSFSGRGPVYASYLSFFETAAFVRVLLFTLLMSLLVTAICVLIGYPVAYLLATVSATLQYGLFVLILVPWLMPELVRNFAWLVILQDNGVLSSLQTIAGLGSRPIISAYSLQAVMVGMVTVQLPLTILPIYAVMRRIDLSLMATASTLGAPPLQVVRTILLPLSMPGVATAFILTFLTTLGFYVTPLMLGGGSHIFMANLIDIEVSRIVDWREGAAMSMILVLAGLGVLAFGNRFVGWRWLIER